MGTAAFSVRRGALMIIVAWRTGSQRKINLRCRANSPFTFLYIS